MLNKNLVLGCLLTACLFGANAVLHAQASPTASKALDIQAGIGFTSIATDYLPDRVSGGMFYTDVDFTPHFGFEGEFHFAKDGASSVYEKTYEVGGRYYRTYGNVVPYVKLMYGRGVFNFPNNAANLAYNLYAIGGGFDYKARPYLNVRIDYEYQKWSGFPPSGLTPNLLSLGVAYHFH